MQLLLKGSGSLPERQVAESTGPVACKDQYSLRSTPKFDLPALDGYAVVSYVTQSASPEKPVKFRVTGATQAGDPEPLLIADGYTDEMPPCVEIMTGAPFPVLDMPDGARSFDACVKWEDTIRLIDS